MGKKKKERKANKLCEVLTEETKARIMRWGGRHCPREARQSPTYKDLRGSYAGARGLAQGGRETGADPASLRAQST